jgi:prepilin-type N-terminal cleavage/methylation domain-containing protein
VSTPAQTQNGFTMIELLVAMAVFSFMLLIISVGFINVVKVHNAAIAANLTQDSSNSAMQAMVQAVRDSEGIVSIVTNPLNSTYGDQLCLKTSGVNQVYLINTSQVLERYDSNSTCTSRSAGQPLTAATNVQATYFKATVETTGATITKPEVSLALTVASGNGTTTGSGATVSCANNNQDRAFCSFMTLTSGAEPR